MNPPPSPFPSLNPALQEMALEYIFEIFSLLSVVRTAGTDCLCTFFLYFLSQHKASE